MKVFKFILTILYGLLYAISIILLCIGTPNDANILIFPTTIVVSALTFYIGLYASYIWAINTTIDCNNSEQLLSYDSMKPKTIFYKSIILASYYILIFTTEILIIVNVSNNYNNKNYTAGSILLFVTLLFGQWPVIIYFVSPTNDFLVEN